MIKLNTLDLENFMCVSKASLDFTDQKVILLIGDNGNGKSAVLDAIALCLNEYCRDSTYKSYIKRHCKESKIKLTGEIYGFPITFEITIVPKGLERKVTYRRAEPYVNSEVTTLLKSLNIKDNYADIIMSMQGGDDDIVKMKPSKRADYLQGLLNYTYEEQTKFAKDNLTAIKNQLTHCTDVITLNNNTINIKKSQILPVPEDTFSSKLKELTGASDIIKNALAQYTGLNEKQLDITNRFNNILREKYSVDNTIKSLEEKLQSLPTLKSTLDQYNKDINSLSVTVTDNLSKSSQLNNSLLKINETISDLDGKRSTFIGALATNRADLATIKKHLSLIDSGKCPECGHEFTSQDRELYEKQLLEKNNEIAALEANQAELSAQINASKGEYQTVSADISNITKEVNLINNKLSTIQVNKPKLEEQISYLENTAASELATKKQELSDLSVKEQNIKSEQDALSASLIEYEKLNNDLRSAQQQINTLNQQILSRENIIKNNNTTSLEIDSLTKDIETQNTLIEDLHRSEAVYKEVLSLIDELRDYAVIKTCAKLEEEINNFIRIVFPDMCVKLYQNKSGIEFFYTKEKLETYTKEDLSNACMASGFEKAALSIAVKVALCKAYDLPFAFFDEADEKGSDTNAANLFKSLLTNGLFDQVFIISQKAIVRDTIKNEVDGVRTYYVSHGNFSLDGDY